VAISTFLVLVNQLICSKINYERRWSS